MAIDFFIIYKEKKMQRQSNPSGDLVRAAAQYAEGLRRSEVISDLGKKKHFGLERLETIESISFIN